MSFDRLIKRIDLLKSPVVVGLDPTLDYIPDNIKSDMFAKHGNTMKAAAEALLRFNVEIIDAIHDVVPAVKPQVAYYEAFGWEGMRVLSQTIEYAKQKGLFVVTDAKRNDIGSTMSAYSTAHLGNTTVNSNTFTAFDGDALTVNGYLGSDGIKPCLQQCADFDKGIFVLVKTSNPSSGELQDKLVDGRPIYEHMGLLCESLGAECGFGEYGYSPVGAVVGATYPEQLTALRKLLPHTFFLVPGYGAQGGTAKDVAQAFDSNGRGAIINSSRGIITAWKKSDKFHAEAAREAAIAMTKDLFSAI